MCKNRHPLTFCSSLSLLISFFFVPSSRLWFCLCFPPLYSLYPCLSTPFGHSSLSSLSLPVIQSLFLLFSTFPSVSVIFLRLSHLSFSLFAACVSAPLQNKLSVPLYLSLCSSCPLSLISVLLLILSFSTGLLLTFFPPHFVSGGFLLSPPSCLSSCVSAVSLHFCPLTVTLFSCLYPSVSLPRLHSGSISSYSSRCPSSQPNQSIDPSFQSALSVRALSPRQPTVTSLCSTGLGCGV